VVAVSLQAAQTQYPGPGQAETAAQAPRGDASFGPLLWFAWRDYARSPWLWINLGILMVVQFFFQRDVPTREEYFGTAYLAALLLGALNSAAVFSRADHPQTLAVLVRPVSRVAYAGALWLVAMLVTLGGYVAMLAASLLRHGPPLQPLNPVNQWMQDPLVFLTGSLPVIAGAALAVSLLALLSNFVAPFGLRLVVLAIVALMVMSFDPRNFLIEQLRPVVQYLPPFVAPVAGALRFATDTVIDPLATISLVMVSAYAVAILAAVLWLTSRREHHMEG
jgi:hypothetical protein